MLWRELIPQRGTANLPDFRLLVSVFTPATCHLSPHDGGCKIALMAGRKKKLSRAEIHALRGSIKFDCGGEAFPERWTKYKREEKELEEGRFRRLATVGNA